MDAELDPSADPQRLPATLVLQAGISRGAGVRTLVFVAAGSLVVGGCIVAIARFSLGAVVAIAVGIAIYAWLLRSEPQVVRVEFFRLDASGVSFVHTPGRRGRVSRYAWSRIERVAIGRGTRGEEWPGLVLSLRPGVAVRDEVVLHLLDGDDLRRARDLAQAWLARRP